MGKNKKETLEIIKEKENKTKEMAKKAVNDYKKFAIKGNVIDMAIGVVIGSAFTNIVNTIVSSTITPLVSLLTSNVDLSTLFITLKGGTFSTLEEAKTAGAITLNYGSLINAILNFFIVSIVLFIIVKIISASNKKDAKTNEKKTKECPYCLSSIPIKATRCAFCTSNLNEKKDIETINKNVSKDENQKKKNNSKKYINKENHKK